MKESIKFLQNLLKSNDTIVIACSTGADSMFLVHTLLKLREEKNLNLIIAHVNHNLREQSETEYAYIKDFCKEKNLFFEYLKIEKYNKQNFHNDARTIRYEFFENVVKKYNAKYLMTAHHGDDLIETILMRITRGSNIRGFSGFNLITNKDKYKIVRPLIYMSKQDIHNYMDENKLVYYNDESNSSAKYTRNRYRKEVLPFLKKENKDVHLKYHEFSKELQEYDQYISSIVLSKINAVFKNNIIDLKNLLKEDKFIVKKIIEEILHIIYEDNLNIINKTHLTMILNLIYLKYNKEIDLPLNKKMIKEYNKIIIVSQKKDKTDYKFILEDKIILEDESTIQYVDNAQSTNNFHLYLDSKEIKLPLIVRNRQNGDAMEVKNLGHKKIKNILIDEHIPKLVRDQIPLLTDSNNQILWIPGIKKSKFDKANSKNYDIILKYIKKEGENYDNE